MAIERRDDDPRGKPGDPRRRDSGSIVDKFRDLPLPAVILIGALAVFGAIAAVQWILASLLGLLKVALVLVILGAVAVWAVSAKANRDTQL